MSFMPRHHVALSFVAALVLFNVYIWSAAYQGYAPATGQLTFAVLNIGQGDALYIEGPTGVQVLMDGGPNSAVLTELPKVMPFFDRSIDAIIESHPDSDHVGGFVDLLKRYKVDAFISPGIPKNNATINTLEQEVTTEHVPRYLARRGMWLDLGGGAKMQILAPEFDPSHLAVKDEHYGCVIAHVVYGATSVLLTCDAPIGLEDHLMKIASTSELKSTILKVAHHGSRYSTGVDFIKEVAPDVAIISVGAGNKYGHPSQDVLSRLASQHVPVLRTDQQGTIIYRSNGQTFTRVQ
jgi:competence protein ComEC